jgi:AraC-like DNA-binding protein
MLGFKDVGSFRRAFRGWTGKSVGAWQQAAAGRGRSTSDSESQLGMG